MTILILGLYIYIIFLFIYTWKDWFLSLCGLIVLTAVAKNPEFPESFAMIQGLNLWNILFANVFLTWLVTRRHQGFFWDMPRNISVFLVLWLGTILFGWVWMMFDRPDNYTLANLISERLINTIKWPLLVFPLFDGCRTRGRIKLALVCICLFFALVTVQVAMSIGPSAVFEIGDMDDRLDMPKKIGISANGAGKMMSGVPWAMLAIMPLFKKWKYKYKFIMLGPCIASLYVIALAGSRSGYIACGATFVLLGLLRWRRRLLLLPLAVLILPIALPGATSRMLLGFGKTDVAGEKTADKYYVTAGRNLIWPTVISKIEESPIFGFGRQAMTRTGVQKELEELDRDVGMAHPHNAYLEVLLDSGIIGFLIIIGLHTVIWAYSIRLFVDRVDPLCSAVGGFALSLLTGHLVAFMGGQSFYPEQIDVGLWCAIGVMLRVYVARGRFVAAMNSASVAGMRMPQYTAALQTPLNWA